MKVALIAFTLVVLTACSSVVMKESFPDSKLTNEEMDALKGTWMIDKDVVYVEFTSNQIPWLAMVEWKDYQFELRKHRLHFTKKNGALYVSMPMEPDGQQSNFFFAEINPREHDIVVGLPDLDFFEKQIKLGTLKGTVRGGDDPSEVILDTPAEELLEFIATNSAAIDFKDPLIIRKAN